MADASDSPGLTCAWCGAQISRRGSRGPVPTYCPGSRCRVAAHRARTGYADWATTRPDVALPPPRPASTSPPVEQVSSALLEARAVSASLIRLGLASPPQLAWRCSRLGRQIDEAIDRLFPDARSRS